MFHPNTGGCLPLKLSSNKKNIESSLVMHALLSWNHRMFAFLMCVIVTSSYRVSVAGARADRSTPAKALLQIAATIPTEGASGFKFFVSTSTPYLAVANFWDGVSKGMGAKSVLYSVAIKQRSGGNLSLTEVQRFNTRGAHGLDWFTVKRSDAGDEINQSFQFLVIPNYYACKRGATDADEKCEGTAIYREMRRKSDSAVFASFQKLPTYGPSQTDHFVAADGSAYIVVGENFNHEVCIFRFVKTDEQSSKLNHQYAFVKHQCMPVLGAGSIAVVEIGTRIFIVASSYHSSKTGWTTQTLVFVAENIVGGETSVGVHFELHQEIETVGCHDANYAFVRGIHFVFLSQDRNSASPHVNSTLLTFNPATQLFQTLQQMATYGAHGAKVFEGPSGHAYVFVSNFGNRKKKKFKAVSTLWRQNTAVVDASNAEEVETARTSFLFSEVAHVRTYGATSAEHFVLHNRHYIAVSSEGDLHGGLHQVSTIYELIELETPQAVKQVSAPAKLVPVEMSGLPVSSVADYSIPQEDDEG